MPAVAQSKAAASILIVVTILLLRRLCGEWSRPPAHHLLIYSRPARAPLHTVEAAVSQMENS